MTVSERLSVSIKAELLEKILKAQRIEMKIGIGGEAFRFSDDTLALLSELLDWAKL